MTSTSKVVPRVVVAALRGGAGKTIVSLGIVAELRNLGHIVAPFKKGPDYIDAGWLALAAGRPCYNLDSYLLSSQQLIDSFSRHTGDADIAVIEGNRGLYDSIDAAGSTSTAEMAKLLAAPLVLCLDCTKTTRTLAAVIQGIQLFDQEVRIQGVVLNRVAGKRHEGILRASIEAYCDVQVVGVIPKLKQEAFPERHLGLVPTHEHAWAPESIEFARQVAQRYLDMRAILEMAADGDNQPTIKIEKKDPALRGSYGATETHPIVGVVRDSAFQFYYPENIEALEAAGTEIVYLSALKDGKLPELHALYIGGGFPETHARALADNSAFRSELKTLAENGLPIYAECGGLMYLGRSLTLENETYPMTGVLPIDFGFERRPQGHGYTELEVIRDNPFYTKGIIIKGHEFHYSKVLRHELPAEQLIFRSLRGNGLVDTTDGATYKNVLATYTHVHALGTVPWAQGLVARARAFQKNKC